MNELGSSIEILDERKKNPAWDDVQVVLPDKSKETEKKYRTLVTVPIPPSRRHSLQAVQYYTIILVYMGTGASIFSFMDGLFQFTLNQWKYGIICVVLGILIILTVLQGSYNQTKSGVRTLLALEAITLLFAFCFIIFRLLVYPPPNNPVYSKDGIHSAGALDEQKNGITFDQNTLNCNYFKHMESLSIICNIFGIIGCTGLLIVTSYLRRAIEEWESSHVTTVKEASKMQKHLSLEI